MSAAPSPTPTRSRSAATAATWASNLPELAGVTQSSMDPVRIEEAMREGYATGHAAGTADGFAAGFAAGEQAGLEALDADRHRMRGALLGLTAQLQALAATEAGVRAAFEDATVDTALALTEIILGRELALAADPGRDALTRALAVAPTDAATATARLHPADAEHIGQLGDLAPGTELTVIPDPAIERGGCVLVMGDTSIDATISASLARIREALA